MVLYTLLGLSLAHARAVPTVAGSRVRRLFIVAVVLTAVWSALGLAIVAKGQPATALGGAYTVLDLARYGAWYGFLTMLLARGGESPRRGLRWSAAGLIAANVLWSFVLAGRPDVAAKYAALLSLALPAFGLILVEQVARSAVEERRWHLKPLVVGLGLVFAFDLYLHSQPLLLGVADADAVAARGAVHAVSAPLLYIASKRHSDWAGPIQMSRSAVFFSTTLLLIGGYLLLIATLGWYLRHVDDNWGRAVATVVVFASLGGLVWLVASPSLRAKLRVMLGKNLFRYRFDYRREWLNLTEVLAGESSPRGIGEAVIRGLATLLDSPSGMLWARAPRGGGFARVANWNFEPRGSTEEPLTGASAFTDFLRDREWVFNLDECRLSPDREDAQLVPPWLLADPRCWLVVPLRAGGDLAGFAVLGRPHATDEVNWETRDILRTAARQAGAFMALGDASEALAEARKFESFNKMSAFVVHDLKNVVAQLSLMSQNARRLGNNPEFQADMVATVENAVEKMRRLLAQLREGDAPAGVASGVPLVPLFGRLQARAKERGRAFGFRHDEPLSTRGHDERLERVLGHLIDNALDATEGAGEVGVSMHREGSQVVLIFNDTGRGMTEVFVKTELFKPFRSTKSSGMGLGAFESLQYVEELGGRLTVASTPGQGTNIEVRLPLFRDEVARAEVGV